jgi:hypothetical protein
MSVVYLPAWLEPKANRFASDFVEEAQGLNPSDKNYKNEYNKAKNRFCKEYYELSTGIQVGNPTSQKAYQTFSVFGDVLFRDGNGFVHKHVKDPEKAQLLASRLKGDIVHLAHIWLENAAAIKVKQADKMFSAMAYAIKTGNREVDAEKMKEVNIHRLKRSFMIACIICAIESVFRIDPNTLDRAVRAAVKNIPQNYLNSEYVYSNLAEALKNPLLAAFKGIDVEKVAEKALLDTNIMPSENQISKIEKGKSK